MKVAFVNERTPETSTWTSQHEFGRTQLDQVFAGKVETVAYHGAEPGKNADELVEKAIQDGADMVFTTSPKLVGGFAARGAAPPGCAHPELLGRYAVCFHPHLLQPRV